SFSGTEGQHVMLQVTGATFNNCDLSIYKPNGVLLVTPTASANFITGCSGYPQIFDIPSLPASGPYTILVAPHGPLTGSVTMQLSTVALQQTGSISIDGPPVSVSINSPGQVAYLTFTGTAGQIILPAEVDGTLGRYYASLVGPPGTGLLFKNARGLSGDPITLPA